MVEMDPRALAGTNGKRAGELPVETDDATALLRQWLYGIRISHVGHRRAATVFARRARILGVSATLASAVVGTTVFASLSESADQRLLVIAAILSVVAVIMSSLQTFLNYGELVAAHRSAGTGYAALRRRVDQIVVFAKPDDLADSMADISTTWTKLDEDSPDLPSGIFEYAVKWVGSRQRS
jgi:hypothetical protein